MNETRIQTADGTRLAVRHLDGEGSLVVALHGFTGNGETMRELVEACRGERAAMLIDIVGHGASDAPEYPEPYVMSSVVDQVLSVIGPRQPGEVHLVGYSMGGRIALSMAARAPWYFGSITAISATPGIDDPIERSARQVKDSELADHVEKIGVEAFVDEWLDQELFAPYRTAIGADGIGRTRTQRLTNTMTGLVGSLQGTGTGAMPPLWKSLTSIRSPLLAIAGSLDMKYVSIAQEMAEAAHNGQFSVVADAGHVTHVENCDEVAVVIGDFLKVCEDNGHLSG